MSTVFEIRDPDIGAVTWALGRAGASLFVGEPLEIGGGPVRCGISIRLMSGAGHFRQLTRRQRSPACPLRSDSDQTGAPQ
jgi:hypothetical protein